MSKLHVATTYKIKWSNIEAFNHKAYEFRLLLNELGVGVAQLGDDYLDFEVTKKDWSEGIIRLISVRDNVAGGLITQKCQAVLDILHELECSLDDVINLFYEYLDAADINDKWMHFSFF